MDQLLDPEMHRMYKHHASNALPFGNVHSAKSGTPTTCAYVCSAPAIGYTTVMPFEHQNRIGQMNGQGRFPVPNLPHVTNDHCEQARRQSNPQNYDVLKVSNPSYNDTDTSIVSDALEEMMLSEENRFSFKSIFARKTANFCSFQR